MTKRLLKTMLLGVALAETMTSCQKDEMKNDILVYHEMSQKNLAQVNPNTLTYWIDGVEYQMELIQKRNNK